MAVERAARGGLRRGPRLRCVDATLVVESVQPRRCEYPAARREGDAARSNDAHLARNESVRRGGNRSRWGGRVRRASRLRPRTRARAGRGARGRAVIPQGVQVFVALDPVDLRCSFDRLSGTTRAAALCSSFSGDVAPHSRFFSSTAPGWPSSTSVSIAVRFRSRRCRTRRRITWRSTTPHSRRSSTGSRSRKHRLRHARRRTGRAQGAIEESV